MMLATISIFKGKLNLCNAYNTIGSCNLFKMLLLFIGHGIDSFATPRENFAGYDFHIAQCLTSFLKHVSPLTSVV